ncbi:MAG: 3,4-dihydroxy-2-butanone-4-phosphate synthase [Promicromonosporaceae bacterium]|nr:3,4-dihydroxy-2-butanone-4-phosphate synthase [Promicromonosporaceae bacterium]
MSSPGEVTAPFSDRLNHALADLRQGKPVLVADNVNREGEVDVVLAADRASEQWVGWLVRHTSGFICAPMSAELADHLKLPLMVEDNQDSLRTAYTISTDAASGVTTGISAADRARTLRVLGNPQSGPGDLIRPGHILPLRAHPGGISARPGHTEAALELVREAGAGEVAVIAELVHDSGRLLSFPEARRLAADSGLAYLSIDELLNET